MEKTQTFTQLVLLREKRKFVTNYFFKNFWQRGLMSTPEYSKFSLGLFDNPEKINLEFEKIINSCIDKGECPRCGSELEIESEVNGLTENQFMETLGFACSQCSWRHK